MRDLLIPQFKNQCEKVEYLISTAPGCAWKLDIPNLQPETETIEIDASGTVSDIEFFQHKDFRMMTHAEMDKAIEAIKSLRLYLPKTISPLSAIIRWFKY